MPVYKSITDLDRFCKFIVSCGNLVWTGDKLCIEYPVKTVDEIIDSQSAKRVRHVKIPGLIHLLMIIAFFTEFIGGFFKIDPILTRSRVAKLFKNTSYDDAKILNHQIDTESYMTYME